MKGDGRRVSVGRRARIFAGIGEPHLAEQQGSRSDWICLIRHDGDASTRRIVSQLLFSHRETNQKMKNIFSSTSLVRSVWNEYARHQHPAMWYHLSHFFFAKLITTRACSTRKCKTSFGWQTPKIGWKKKKKIFEIFKFWRCDFLDACRAAEWKWPSTFHYAKHLVVFELLAPAKICRHYEFWHKFSTFEKCPPKKIFFKIKIK